MSKEGKQFTPEEKEMARLQKRRVLHDARAIENGAEMSPKGELILTKEQKRQAHEEMEYYEKGLNYDLFGGYQKFSFELDRAFDPTEGFKEHYGHHQGTGLHELNELLEHLRTLEADYDVQLGLYDDLRQMMKDVRDGNLDEAMETRDELNIYRRGLFEGMQAMIMRGQKKVVSSKQDKE